MRSIRYAAAAITLAAAATLAGCGSSHNTVSTPPPTGQPTATSQPTASDAPSTNPSTGVTDYCGKNQAPATGPAATQFGAKNVLAAYCEMVGFTIDNSFTSLMERAPQAQDFDFLKPWFTPGGWASVQKVVPGAVAGSNPQQGDLFAITAFNMSAGSVPGLRVRANQTAPLETGPSVTAAKTAVDTTQGVPRLAMTLTMTVQVGMSTTSGANYLVPLSKTVTYWLVPNGSPSRPWLIDAANGSIRSTGSPVRISN